MSAFRNKLENDTVSTSGFRFIGVEILRRIRKTTEKLKKRKINVAFSEFVNFILDKRIRRRESLNEHWAPYTELCHPCIIPYDFIGKYETLHEDAENILRLINAPKNLHFPSLVHSVTSTLTPRYIDTLTAGEQRHLYAMYQPDFLLFDYRTPPVRNDSAIDET